MQFNNLTNILQKYKDSTFSWGKLDCCIFTVKVVEEYTGKTLPFWREVTFYKGYRESKKALKKLGCKDLVDLPSIILNTPKKPISAVKHGEPVYYINEEGEGILGICNGVRAYFLIKGGGLTTRNVKECLYCWSID
jgi:hypothetical protein